MKKKSNSAIVTLVLIVLVLTVASISGCTSTATDSDKYTVVATTTMLADMARVIGGDLVEVEALMGPGIDPHLYNASAGDVDKMTRADLVVYNGLHLEGKMTEVFENLVRTDLIVVEIVSGIGEGKLVTDDATGVHDPHIWFDVLLWKEAAYNLYDGLVAMDPNNKETYEVNYNTFLDELVELDEYVKEQVASVPEQSRVLITAHDAFAYFGNAYGFEVMGLQGISTESEAGTGDVTALANYIVKNEIKAIFVESSVPRKNIEALQEAVAAQGFNVEIGGELFSDSLGTEGTDAETYIGTVRHNIDTIVGALK